MRRTNKEKLRGVGKKVGAIVAYYAVLGVGLFLIRLLSDPPKISPPILLIVLLAPFLIVRLSGIEYGGLKVVLRDLTREVAEVRKDVNQRLEQLSMQTRDYLGTRPLGLADQKIEQMRNTINLSDDEVVQGLKTLDAEQRVPAYVQIQAHPDRSYLTLLAPCYWIEQIYASRTLDTRPLWQLLVATQFSHNLPGEVGESVPLVLVMSLRHCLEYLQLSSDLDRGGQCKARLASILRDLDG